MLCHSLYDISIQHTSTHLLTLHMLCNVSVLTYISRP